MIQLSHQRPPAILLGIFLLAFFIKPGWAQTSIDRQGQLELGASLTLSPALRIQRSYDIQPGGSDISSSGSPGFEGYLGLSRPLSKNSRWMTGIAYGVYSYNIALYVTDEFNRLGWGGYADNYTQFEIQYSSFLAGIRLDFPILGNDLLFLQPALRMTYHWRSYSELAAYAILDSGGIKQLFQAEMINNDNNDLIISPELGLFYQLNPAVGRLGLIAGANIVYSGQSPFSGDYQIVGDSDILEGTLRKRFLHLGASVAVFWKLNQ